jgi:hypothetical protein
MDIYKKVLHDLYFDQSQLFEQLEKELTSNHNHIVTKKDNEIAILKQQNAELKERNVTLLNTIVELSQKLLTHTPLAILPPIQPLADTVKGDVETVVHTKSVIMAEIVPTSNDNVKGDVDEEMVEETVEEEAEEEAEEEEEMVKEMVEEEEEMVEKEEETVSTSNDNVKGDVDEEEVEEEVEEDVEEEEAEELYEVIIKGNTYYVINETDGPIYKLDENDDPTIEAGIYKNGKAKFYKTA